MFNRGAYNSFKYNSVPLQLIEEEEVIPQQQVGGNFTGKPKQVRKRRFNRIPFITSIDLVGTKLVDFKLIFKLIGIKLVTNKVTLGLKANKTAQKSNAYIVSGIKESKFNYNQPIKGSYLSDLNFTSKLSGLKLFEIAKDLTLVREFLIGQENTFNVSATKEVYEDEVIVSLLTGSKINSFINTNKLSAIKKVEFNKNINLKAKRDIRDLLSLSLMDI